MCLIQLLILIEHLCLSGMWVDVAPKTDTKKTIMLKGLDCVLKNMMTILILIVSIIGETYYDHLISTRIF